MKEHDQKLQRLHDGELTEEEGRALRASLGASPADEEKLAALAEVDALVRGALLTEAEGVDLWGGIEARLPAAGGTTAAADGDGGGAVGSPQSASRPGAGRRRLSMAVTAAATALAMAASFIVWLVPGPRQTNRCEIESLEVAGAMATVMEIPGEAGDSTTLIWMDHKESDEWESLD
jgi:hypothetical protein